MAIDADTAAAPWLRLAPPCGPRPSVAAPSESAQRLSGALLELEIESGFSLAHADPCNFAVGPGSIYNCVLLTNLKIFIYIHVNKYFQLLSKTLCKWSIAKSQGSACASLESGFDFEFG